MQSLVYLIPIIALSIPIIGILAKSFTKWMELKERQLQAQTHETAERTAQYAAHTERLEQRMRVLERIITDKGLAISEEIESLRDKTSSDLTN